MFLLIKDFAVVLAGLLGDRLGHNSSDVITIIEYFGSLVELKEEGEEELAELVEEIKAMKESGVVLSRERIEQFRQRRAELSGDISAIREGRELEAIAASDDRERLQAEVDSGGDPVLAAAARARLDELGPAE